MSQLAPGCELHAEYLDLPAQRALVEAVRDVVRVAPLFAPVTRRGKMSVRMTSAGKYGWVSDRSGYRYETRHPEGMPWPDIPPGILSIWRDLAPGAPDAQCCLINWYGENARMGLHQDRDEADFRWPVVSVSLGDSALFRIGGVERGGRTTSVWLASGDVIVMGGESRLVHHGIDRIRFGSSTLLEGGGRINLTLRVVD